MKTVIGYARFSSNMQREESVDAQLRAIKHYCEQNGYILLATYADRGISGTSAEKRPEFQKMIARSPEDLRHLAILLIPLRESTF